MEWGVFITVIAAIYLAWYGLNFLYDLFIVGKPKVAAESATQYNISGLVAEEEPARIVNASDFEEKPVNVHKDAAETPQPKPPVAPPPATSSPTQKIANDPAPTPTPKILPMVEDDTEDWAEIATRVEDQKQAIEEKIDIPVQGQPVKANEFFNTLKDEAKTAAAAITF